MAKAKRTPKTKAPKRKVVRQHDPQLREKCVALLMLPDGPSANELSKEAIGVSQTTLSKWLREAKQEKKLAEARRTKPASARPRVVEGDSDNVTFIAQISIPRAALVEAVLREDSVIDLTTVLRAQTGTDN
jgi:transposase-like protein